MAEAAKRKPRKSPVKSVPPADPQPDQPVVVEDVTDDTQTIEVTAEELAALENMRELKKAVEQHPANGDVPVGPQGQPLILVEDERAQREIDLRAVNEQIIQTRQALSAAKLNRLLNAEGGMLHESLRKHDKQFRQDIHEIRETLNFLIATKAAMGPTGIEEPAFSPLEVADADLDALAQGAPVG
ncbi:MAG TPA: hypothetical protein VFQ40_07460 [Actinomycetota bacterium]|nr:hypothetical protein [Actinomycetota bacterium]